ncbi:hypothetical protein [Streptomyces sp. NPDC017958]
MSAEQQLKKADALFTTEARTSVPTAAARHRKPSGQGDQRTNEDD